MGHRLIHRARKGGLQLRRGITTITPGRAADWAVARIPGTQKVLATQDKSYLTAKLIHRTRLRVSTIDYTNAANTLNRTPRNKHKRAIQMAAECPREVAGYPQNFAREPFGETDVARLAESCYRGHAECGEGTLMAGGAAGRDK
jgi:hypothetical protein